MTLALKAVSALKRLRASESEIREVRVEAHPEAVEGAHPSGVAALEAAGAGQ
jgi:hypothetical protein